MAFETQTLQVFDFKAYVKRQFNLLRRAKSLPEDKVESLAREALRRLAERDVSLDTTLHDIAPSEEVLADFCAALISENDTAAADIILRLNAKQVSPEFVYLSYLAAAARMLGDWWEEDRVGFWQVTVGTGRLLAIMRSMSHLFESTVRLEQKTAIFASVPGEQHVLGMHMAADLFQKDGWNIAMKVGLDHDQLISEIEHTPTDVIGLSMGGGHALDALSKLVVALHISRPNTPIVLSGHGVMSIRPKLAWMELDGVFEDVDEAKSKMNEIWELRKDRSHLHVVRTADKG
ncbi:cobalamin B12-binding domain-containing protein [Roseovarius phycicola]|uniref:cobalamin B12-binding domain-containing protein n=1 Tax=Roseovarius phycicola TaxID=3080976 RepID=UPI0030D00B79